jgi:hypothetical protein
MLDGNRDRAQAVARAPLSDEAVFRRAEAAVGMRARRGEPLATIEHEVIAPSGLSEEHKSELSLHGSTYLEAGRRRYEQRQDRVRRRAGRRTSVQGAE